ncbi:unnamed protein product [Diamesa hyperborea]
MKDFVNINQIHEEEQEGWTENYKVALKFEIDMLHLKYKYYIKYPMDHPVYATELSTYKLKMTRKIQNFAGAFSTTYDSTADWEKHWKTILNKYFTDEVKNIKKILEKQFHLPSKNKQIPSCSKSNPVQKITKSKHSRITFEEEELIPVKKIKLDVKDSPEIGGTYPLILLCKRLKNYVLGDLNLKANNLYEEAIKKRFDEKLDLLQDHRNVKLLENIKTILIDQTSYLPLSKIIEIKQVIEDIKKLLLNRVTIAPTPKPKQRSEYLSKDELKTLALNFSVLPSVHQNELVKYFEIMKVKNDNFYDKMKTIIQNNITVSDEDESSSVVDKVKEVPFVVLDDGEDDYDLSEVVLKSKLIVAATSTCPPKYEFEIPTIDISSDEN